ncbi:MAG: hypothetical protein PHC94_06255 [Methylobacter sp.]|nr:hypothetical protein [Methylococcales bacterium]MDD5113600.1 hypothetical protein [Methylobacter sp.]
MSTTKPKTKKIATNLLETAAPINKEVRKELPKKATPEKSSAVSEATNAVNVVELVENEVKSRQKKTKAIKAKVIRDSFSFPEEDYLKISALKKACLAAGIHIKKGEILRAGLHLLTQLNPDELKQAVEQVEKVQTGRPKAS